MGERLGRMLSLARKAGKLVWGFDSVKARLDKDTVLVMFASDLSEGSRRRLERLATEKGVPCVDVGLSLDELWYYIGKRAGILALTDRGFAQKALELIGAQPVQNGFKTAPCRPDQ